MLLVVVCDSLCFVVLQVLVYFYPDMPHHVIVYHLTVTLSSLNSCMDPVVYCFVTNNFKVSLKSFPVSLLHFVHFKNLSTLSPICLSLKTFVHPSLSVVVHWIIYDHCCPQATMRHLFRRAEPEQTSGEIVSMQHSSKASEGAVNAITNNVIMMTKIPSALQRSNLRKNHTL